jgi:ABC-type lipoprotein export system ATPase subunit
MPPVITLSHVSVATPDGLPLLIDIGLAVSDGECVAIVGRSGSGKSTLLKLLDGRTRARSGSVQVAGIDLRQLSYDDERALRTRIGFIFQTGGLLANTTIKDNVGLGLAYHSVPAMPPADLASRVAVIAEELGIEAFLGERTAAASTSVHKRALVARALLMEPPILLADEPFASLSPNEADLVAVAIARRIAERRMTVLVASHAPPPPELGATRTLYLEAGQIQRTPPGEEPRQSRVPA